jgi:hypothetical protein
MKKLGALRLRGEGPFAWGKEHPLYFMEKWGA